MRNPAPQRWLVVLLLPLLVLALGLINPTFTPEHLAKGARAILRLDLGAAGADGTLTVKSSAAWKGAASANLRLVVGPEAKGFAAELGEGGAGLLFLGDFSGARDGGNAPQGISGVVCVGAKWFLLKSEADGRLTISDDEGRLDLKAVWSGGERSLEGVVSTLLADPRTTVPVACEMAWRDSVSLGRVEGNLHGCIPARFAAGETAGILVLSEGGDRYFRHDTKTGTYVDRSAQVKLASRSIHAVIGDLSGTGRHDLASWDGRQLRVWSLDAGGALVAPTSGLDLPEACRGLALCAASATRAGVLVSTASWPLLASRDAAGLVTAKPVATGSFAAAWGEAGPCVVADFDNDGREDIVQACGKGLLFYRGEAPGRWQTPQVACATALGTRSVSLGDFDGDGLLDLLVCGGSPWRLLGNRGGGIFHDDTAGSGEAAYSAQGDIGAAIVNDLNSDGREEPCFLRHGAAPLPFFNRGSACFGWASELDTENNPDLPGLLAVANGQSGGLAADLDGDGLQELVLIGEKSQEVWVFRGKAEGWRAGLAVDAAAGVPGPQRLTARDGKRNLGVRLALPAAPAFFGKRGKGPLDLAWLDIGTGKEATQRVALTKSGQAFRLPTAP